MGPRRKKKYQQVHEEGESQQTDNETYIYELETKLARRNERIAKLKDLVIAGQKETETKLEQFNKQIQLIEASNLIKTLTQNQTQITHNINTENDNNSNLMDLQFPNLNTPII